MEPRPDDGWVDGPLGQADPSTLASNLRRLISLSKVAGFGRPLYARARACCRDAMILESAFFRYQWSMYAEDGRVLQYRSPGLPADWSTRATRGGHSSADTEILHLLRAIFSLVQLLLDGGDAFPSDGWERLAAAADLIEAVYPTVPQVASTSPPLLIEGDDAADGDGEITPPRLLKLGPKEYRLTEQQVLIWQFFRNRATAQLDEIMSTKAGAVWPKKYTVKHLRTIRTALSTLTNQLIDAGVSFHVVGEHVEKRTKSL